MNYHLTVKNIMHIYAFYYSSRHEGNKGTTHDYGISHFTRISPLFTPKRPMTSNGTGSEVLDLISFLLELMTQRSHSVYSLGRTHDSGTHIQHHKQTSLNNGQDIAMPRK